MQQPIGCPILLRLSPACARNASEIQKTSAILPENLPRATPIRVVDLEGEMFVTRADRAWPTRRSPLADRQRLPISTACSETAD